MQDRRMFLAGAAAAAALPIVGGGIAWAQSQSRRVSAAPDAVLDELQRQLIDIGRKSTRPGRAVTGEVGRQLGSATRMLGAHLGAKGFERNFQAALRKTVSTEGRAAFLQRRPNFEHVVAELRAHGLDIDLSRISLPPENLELRGKALDFLMQNGVRRGLQRVAEGADAAAAELDKFVGGRLVQWGPWSGPNCGSLQWDLFMLEIMMIMACGPLVETVAACVAATTVYMTYVYLVWAVGC